MKRKKIDCGAATLGFLLGFLVGIIILKSSGLI